MKPTFRLINTLGKTSLVLQQGVAVTTGNLNGFNRFQRFFHFEISNLQIQILVPARDLALRFHPCKS